MTQMLLLNNKMSMKHGMDQQNVENWSSEFGFKDKLFEESEIELNSLEEMIEIPEAILKLEASA